MRAGGGAAHHETPTSAERPEGRLPALLACAVDHHVRSPTIGELPHFRCDIRPAVVDQTSGTKLPGAVQLGVYSTGDDGSGTQEQSHLQRGESHSATYPADQ